LSVYIGGEKVVVKDRKNVLLFGGAFNPPTIGHCHAAFSAIEDLAYEPLTGTGAWFVPDEVWFLPFYREQPGQSELEHFMYRVDMLKQMINHELSSTYFKVCTLGRSLDPNINVYDLIMELRAHHTNIQFSYLMGADQLEHIKTCTNSKKLLCDVDFVVIDRNEILKKKPELADILGITKRVITDSHRHITSDVVRMATTSSSSMVVREAFKNRRSDYAVSLHRFLCPAVQKYIMNNHLYVKESYIEQNSYSRFV